MTAAAARPATAVAATGPDSEPARLLEGLLRGVALAYLVKLYGMGMRRFTRLTNGFSKKVENDAHAVALHFMRYNFRRTH